MAAAEAAILGRVNTESSGRCAGVPMTPAVDLHARRSAPPLTPAKGGRAAPPKVDGGAPLGVADRARPSGRLDAAVNAELVVDVADVGGDGLLADEQPRGDLAVGEP